MEYVVLGNTGIQVSELCLGTMTFGKEADEAASAAIIRRARASGINFMDTANVYNQGRTEEIIGREIAGWRDEVVLASKVHGKMGDGPNERGLSRRHIVQAVEASLRRLRTDRLDLYFLHAPDPLTPLEETFAAVDHLVRAGKVLHLGMSNYAAWQTMKAIGICRERWLSPVVCIQPMYNLVKRQAEVELLPMALSEGLAVIPYNPLGGGFLTGKYLGGEFSKGKRLSENDMYRKRYSRGWYMEAVERFTDYARKHGEDPAPLAIAWVLAHPAVTAPIIGARSVEQLEASLKAIDISMPPERRAEIAALSIEPPPATDRWEEKVK